MLCAVEQDVACVGPVDAGDQVEERRLAGAVRADHADDLALVDVQVEARRRPSGRRTRARRRCSSSMRHQTISTRRSPSSPFGRRIISAIRISAEHDVARRLGLREHHVLPDERGEVERRHEQRRAAPAAHERQHERQRDQADVRRRRDPAREVRGHDDPVVDRRPRSRPAARPRPRSASIAPRDLVHREAERERRERDDAERARAARRERAAPPTSADEEDDRATCPGRAGARAAGR